MTLPDEWQALKTRAERAPIGSRIKRRYDLEGYVRELLRAEVGQRGGYDNHTLDSPVVLKPHELELLRDGGAEFCPNDGEMCPDGYCETECERRVGPASNTRAAA